MNFLNIKVNFRIFEKLIKLSILNKFVNQHKTIVSSAEFQLFTKRKVSQVFLILTKCTQPLKTETNTVGARIPNEFGI